MGRRHQITPFRYYLRVRYIECDAQKVVFNSRYGEYVIDVARRAGLTRAQVLNTLSLDALRRSFSR